MAALNHSTIIKGLEKLIEEKNFGQFFFDFLKVFKFPAATIKRLQEANSNRNVGISPGDYGLAKQIYFHPAQNGEDLRQAITSLVNSPALQKHQIRFFLTTNFVDAVAYDKRVDDWTSFAFEDLRENYEFFLPLTGLYEKPLAFTSHPADVKACEKMGRLYDIIRTLNHYNASNIHELNVFLTRLLFCFFAEDTGIFPKPCQMTAAIESLTQSDGSDLSDFFSRLFVILDAKPESPVRQSETATLAAFPYVNGGLFREVCRVPTLNAKARTLLLECGKLEWNQISPVIFGSMFQSVMDPEARHERGAHYTSEKNIFKVIRPLFLDALEEELLQLLQLKDRYEKRKRLEAYRSKLSTLRFLDPACGSGNFLIVAYREIKSLELKALTAELELSYDRSLSVLVNWEKFSKVSIDQFYGIEIEEFPVEIARVSMWLMDHVMHLKFGKKLGLVFPSIPLKTSANFHCGNALTTNWADIINPSNLSYILGNPPFVGAKMMDETQKNDATNIFGKIKIANSLDYVAAWFFKASKFSQNSSIRTAFVATNSITQGEQAMPIWSTLFNKYNIKIDFAYRTFNWQNEAPNSAKVHCVIIGFSNKSLKLEKHIFTENESRIVNNINPYLVDAPDVFIEKRAIPICEVPSIDYGSMPNDGGNFLLSTDEKKSLIEQDPGLEKWIKRFKGATEFINGKERWCLWLKDASEDDINASPELKRRVSAVRSLRQSSSASATREKAKVPNEFFYCSHPKNGHYLLIPRTSSERREYIPIGFEETDTVSSDANCIVSGASLFHFGILTSRMHMIWMRTVAGRLKSDYRYSGSIVYNTFPWPEANDKQCQIINNLANNILMLREFYPDMTLAELYDPDKMPNDLRKAHTELDLAVDKLYRNAPFENDEARLRHLFTRYEKLIEAESNTAPSKE